MSELNDISYRAMMGEFILYYRDKVVGGIYDGAKEMLLVDDVDNKEYLSGLFIAMYDELPTPKAKKKK